MVFTQNQKVVLFIIFLFWSVVGSTSDGAGGTSRGSCRVIWSEDAALARGPIKVLIGIGNSNGAGEVERTRQSLGLLAVDALRFNRDSPEVKIPFADKVEDYVEIDLASSGARAGQSADAAKKRFLSQATQLGIEYEFLSEYRVGLLVGVRLFWLNEDVASNFFNLGDLKGTRLLVLEPYPIGDFAGPLIRDVLTRYGLSSRDIMVVQSDLDIMPGRLAAKWFDNRAEKPHVHPGVMSMGAYVGEGIFPVIRVGIGRPPEGLSVNDYLREPVGGDEDGERILPGLSVALQMGPSLGRIAIGEFTSLTDAIKVNPMAENKQRNFAAAAMRSNDYFSLGDLKKFLASLGLRLVNEYSPWATGSPYALGGNENGTFIFRVEPIDGMVHLDSLNDNFIYMVEYSSSSNFNPVPYRRQDFR